MAFFSTLNKFVNTAANKVRSVASNVFSGIASAPAAISSGVSSNLPSPQQAQPTRQTFSQTQAQQSAPLLSTLTGTPQTAGSTSPISVGQQPFLAPILPGLSIGQGGAIQGTPQLPQFISSPFSGATFSTSPVSQPQTTSQPRQTQQTQVPQPNVQPSPLAGLAFPQTNLSNQTTSPTTQNTSSIGQRGQGIPAGRGNFLPTLFGTPTAQAGEQQIAGKTVAERQQLQNLNPFASFVPQSLQNFSANFSVPLPPQDRGFGISTDGTAATSRAQFSGQNLQNLNLAGVKSLSDTLTALNESLNTIRLQVEQQNPLPQDPIIPPPPDRMDIQRELLGQWDAMQKQLGIPQSIAELDAAGKDLQAVRFAFDSSLEEVQSDPNLSKTLKGRWLDYIQEKSAAALNAASSRYQFALQKYQVLEGQLKDQFGIVEKAFDISLEAQQAERERLLNIQQQELNTIRNLAIKYPNAGINQNDDFDNAIRKAGVVASQKEKAELDLLKAQVDATRALAQQRTSTSVEPKQFQFAAAGYAARLVQSNQIFDSLESQISSLSGINLLAERLKPNILKSDFIRQQEQAENNFINALLRRESGAAVSDIERNEYRKQYFPQPGDDATTLAQKKLNRQIAEQALTKEAGPAFFNPFEPQSFASNATPQVATQLLEDLKNSRPDLRSKIDEARGNGYSDVEIYNFLKGQ